MKRKTRRTQFDPGVTENVTAEIARGTLATRATIAVCAAVDEGAVQVQAAQLAAQFGWPLVSVGDSSHNALLTATPERLELRFPRSRLGPLSVDFVGGSLGYSRRLNRFGLLFQAIGFRNGRPKVLDATAGLGSDAFRLAYHGCRVTAIERSPIPFVLLQDGLLRAARVPEVREQLGDRLCLLYADARDVLQRLTAEDAPDVVYLDPMFPAQKKSALAKMEMRVLRQFVGNDPDAKELFVLARSIARQRVVVKRHRHAEPLAPHPTHSHGDKTIRYDVYLCSSRREM